MALASLLLLLITASPGQGTSSTLVGCLNRLPDGTLQLGTRPSGRVYSVEGNTRPLMAHVNQFIRVSAQTAPAGTKAEGVAKISVSSVEVIASTCTAGPPGKNPQAVGGKVGEDQIAVPVANTAGVDEITPGFQTESATTRPQNNKSEHQPALRPGGAYAPFQPEQVAQSETAANVNAEAAIRAEILPGNTLGVNGSTKSTPGSHTTAEGEVPSTSHQGRTIVVEITGEQQAKLSPQRLTIQAGQTVEWKNSSKTTHEIVGNPAKSGGASNSTLPNGARPFDSGFLRPEHTFSRKFDVSGVYRYTCDLNSSHPVTGEIVVSP
jgi:plastocyanin